MGKPVVLVTGSGGFIGKNLVLRLRELGNEVVEFTRSDDAGRLEQAVAGADAIVHLAGENRPRDPAEFDRVNAGLTKQLCRLVATSGRTPRMILASSAQATLDNPYGASKRAAEAAVEGLAREGVPAAIFRLPGVFGKWCKPNYNSVVATFCHNIARDLPIRVDNPAAQLRLVYIDDVVSALVDAISATDKGLQWPAVAPEYETTLGELAAQIRSFDNCRTTLMTERVGTGFVRALYATYVSYLPNDRFAYDVPAHGDARGVFVEVLKTPDCGQFSYFTAHPGITRGGHYHHTKTEKFIVIKGRALFRFRHLLTGEEYALNSSGEKPTVVETIPGWAHDITNIGEDELVVMLWANEVFDRDRPDTIYSKV